MIRNNVPFTFMLNVLLGIVAICNIHHGFLYHGCSVQGAALISYICLLPGSSLCCRVRKHVRIFKGMQTEDEFKCLGQLIKHARNSAGWQVPATSSKEQCQMGDYAECDTRLHDCQSRHTVSSSACAPRLLNFCHNTALFSLALTITECNKSAIFRTL